MYKAVAHVTFFPQNRCHGSTLSTVTSGVLCTVNNAGLSKACINAQHTNLARETNVDTQRANTKLLLHSTLK